MRRKKRARKDGQEKEGEDSRRRRKGTENLKTSSLFAPSINGTPCFTDPRAANSMFRTRRSTHLATMQVRVKASAGVEQGRLPVCQLQKRSGCAIMLG